MCGENPSPQNEDNLQRCIKEKSIDLGQCIIDCKNDQSCEESCVDSFKEQYDQCPCQVRRSQKFNDFRRLEFLVLPNIFRMIAPLDALVTHSIVNRTKNPF